MRIVVGSLQYETNSFSPLKTTRRSFDVVKGKQMLEKIAVSSMFKQAGAQLIPTLYANALPSGKMEESSFIEFKDYILSKIPQYTDIDGVWLYLHGAMEVENIGSGDAILVSEVRKKVGPQVPISVALDFHANNTDLLINSANIICGYRTAPHVDQEETQIRAGQLLLKCIEEKLLPKPVMVKPPMMLTGDMVTTSSEPGRTLIKELEALEEKEDLLCISLFNGQPWVDAPYTGASIIAIAKTDEQAAFDAAKHLGRLFWEARSRFRFEQEALAPEEAMHMAIASRQRLVFICDSGDNTTAGAPGDNAYLLSILLKKGVQNALVAGVTDSGVVRQCTGYDIGTEASFHIGGELDRKNSKSVQVKGVLKGKGSVPSWSGESSIPSVVINVNGCDVVVTEKPSAFISPVEFQSAGVCLSDYKIVVVKLGYLFAELKGISGLTILTLTPGASCEDIGRLEFNNINRPMYPIDKTFDWFMEK